MQYLKAHGIKVAIITEGPIDAQEWALQQLGLMPLIDRLFTSNQEGISKKDGLFQIALKKLHISANKILHICDSYHHDIVPARVLGISVLWYNPEQRQQFPLLNSC